MNRKTWAWLIVALMTASGAYGFGFGTGGGGNMTAAEKSKLAGLDNTSDANKPVSTAQQAALDAKLNATALSDTAYDASAWNGDTTHTATKNAIRDYLESLFPSGTDGTFGLVMANNTSRSPTASTDELYFEGNILKTNQNGTESSVAIGPTGTQINFSGTLTNGKACTFATGGTISCNTDIGAGSIGGSTGSTDNALLRADGTGGATIQGSGCTLDDSGNLTCASFLTPQQASSNPDTYTWRGYGTNGRGFYMDNPAAEPSNSFGLHVWTSEPAANQVPYVSSFSSHVGQWGWLTLGALATTSPGTGVATAAGNAVNASGGLLTYGSAAGAASVLTGYTSGAGTVAATDTILEAVQKLNGNQAAMPVMPSETDGDIIYGASSSWTKGTALPNGITATTQAAQSNDTKVATNAYVDTATPYFYSGTSITIARENAYAVCTGDCTVTPPAPAAGKQFCVRNDPGGAHTITLAALGTGNYYEKPDHSGYGTANATFTATAGATNQACFVGLDANHYLLMGAVGTWTAN